MSVAVKICRSKNVHQSLVGMLLDFWTQFSLPLNRTTNSRDESVVDCPTHNSLYILVANMGPLYIFLAQRGIHQRITNRASMSTLGIMVTLDGLPGITPVLHHHRRHSHASITLALRVILSDVRVLLAALKTCSHSVAAVSNV
jgi:hypothetical protein